MGMSLEDLQASEAFGGSAGRRAEVTFLPEPEPRERWATIVSVDDHVVEPPDAFVDRFPAKYRDAAPASSPPTTAARRGSGTASSSRTSGSTPSPGRPSSEYGFEPTRFDEMRRGAWDVRARLADMDVNGVWGSLCFPSFLPGFVGQRLTTWPDDEDLALAAMRAYNDWHLEAWCGAAPDRFIPNQITWLRDPQLAADEVRRNAARGFRALTFSEAPEKLGLPSLHTGYWDPLFAACEETETVVCLHVGSSGSSPMTAPDAPPETVAVLFFAYGMYAAVDWLYSKVPVRFPNLRIALSEGGIGWVAGLDRPARPLLRVPARLPADVARRRPHAERGAAPQLLVLRDRRHVGLPDPRRDRRRPPARRVRLPARRLHLARHPTAPARAARAASPTTRSAASAGRTRSSSSACPPHRRPAHDPPRPIGTLTAVALALGAPRRAPRRAARRPRRGGRDLLPLHVAHGKRTAIIDTDGRQVTLRGVNLNSLGDYYQDDPHLPPVVPVTGADWDRDGRARLQRRAAARLVVARSSRGPATSTARTSR